MNKKIYLTWEKLKKLEEIGGFAGNIVPEILSDFDYENEEFREYVENLARLNKQRKEEINKLNNI